MSYEHAYEMRQSILDQTNAQPGICLRDLEAELGAAKAGLNNWITQLLKAGEMRVEVSYVKGQKISRYWPLAQQTYYSGNGSHNMQERKDKIKEAKSKKDKPIARKVILSDKPAYPNQGGQGQSVRRGFTSLAMIGY